MNSDTINFQYSISLLKMLLDLEVINEKEYSKIAKVSAEYYGQKEYV